MSNLEGLTVVIPAHKEDPAFITKTYCELQMMGAYVIVVDDGNTMELPDEVNVVTYPAHMGYGYAIKQGIQRAETNIICTMDGDGQHTVEDVVKLYTVYKLISNCRMLVGARWCIKEKPHRWIGRKILNFIASLIGGHYMVDLNSGMRIFDKYLAIGYSPILCDTFSFTTSLTMSMVTDNHKIAYFPIDVKPRSHGSSHVKVVKDGLITLYYIVWIGIALRTRKLRKWLRSLLRK
jgi:polyisoprenyl-phosphate glycosyltransferase